MIGAVAMAGGASGVAATIKLSVRRIEDCVDRDIGAAGMATETLQLGGVHVLFGQHSVGSAHEYDGQQKRLVPVVNHQTTAP
jgi:hypothetical protein